LHLHRLGRASSAAEDLSDLCLNQTQRSIPPSIENIRLIGIGIEKHEKEIVAKQIHLLDGFWHVHGREHELLATHDCLIKVCIVGKSLDLSFWDCAFIPPLPPYERSTLASSNISRYRSSLETFLVT
jgi:hypothetical protein